MDDVPPVAHLSSDEDDESAKTPSAKSSDVRQRGPPKKLSREARAACRLYSGTGVPHKLLAARYNCSTHMISRVVNNSFRIPDNLDSDEDHFDLSEDKDAPKDYESYVSRAPQQHRGSHKKGSKEEKKQHIKLIVRDQSATNSTAPPVSTKSASGPSALTRQMSASEPPSPIKDRPKSGSPSSLPPEAALSISSTSFPVASSTPLSSHWGVKRKREDFLHNSQVLWKPLDDRYRSHQTEKQPRLNGSKPAEVVPSIPAAPSTTSTSTSRLSSQVERAKETPILPVNGRFDELDQSSSGDDLTSRPHRSEGTPSSASLSRYTLVPTTAEDFLPPAPEPPSSASVLAQADELDTDEPMEEDDPGPTQLTSHPEPKVQSTARAQAQPHRQRAREPPPTPKPVPPPVNPLSEVEAFLKALKPDLSSLLPTFDELGIKNGEYLDGLRSIPRKDNKEWFDELTAKGIFTPFQAHVILRALYN